MINNGLRLCDIIDDLKRFKGGASLRFDFGYEVPGDLMSYRGFYEDLAVEPVEDGERTVADFLKACEAAVGATYCGYKGGKYTMNANATVWVSRYGDATGTDIRGFHDEGYEVVILTGYTPV
jgi:hypothetical protein